MVKCPMRARMTMIREGARRASATVPSGSDLFPGHHHGTHAGTVDACHPPGPAVPIGRARPGRVARLRRPLRPPDLQVVPPLATPGRRCRGGDPARARAPARQDEALRLRPVAELPGLAEDRHASFLAQPGRRPEGRGGRRRGERSVGHAAHCGGPRRPGPAAGAGIRSRAAGAGDAAGPGPGGAP